MSIEITMDDIHKALDIIAESHTCIFCEKHDKQVKHFASMLGMFYAHEQCINEFLDGLKYFYHEPHK